MHVCTWSLFYCHFHCCCYCYYFHCYFIEFEISKHSLKWFSLTNILYSFFLSFISPFSSYRFNLDKRFQYKCSWKSFSIALIFLSVILSALLAYFAGKWFLFSINKFILIYWKHKKKYFPRMLYMDGCTLNFFFQDLSFHLHSNSLT